MENSLSDTRSVLQEAIRVFNNPAHDVEAIKAVKAKMSEMEAQQQAKQLEMKQAIKAMTSQIESVGRIEAPLQELQQRLVQVQDQSRSTEKDSLVDEPALKYTESLYSNLTNIRWDYDTELVKGFVSVGNDIRPFQLDPKKLSPFYITNHLWELM